MRFLTLFFFTFACILAIVTSQNPIDFIKVNCGGQGIEDIGFLADEAYFRSESTAPTVATSHPTPTLPAGDEWGEVYSTQIYADGGTLIYRFPVPDGTYNVGLMFSEQFKGSARAGARVFDLHINDVPLDLGIDVWSAAGGKLHTRHYINKTGLSPVGGYMKISLVPVVENPMLSGLVIEGPDVASILWETSAPPSAQGQSTNDLITIPGRNAPTAQVKSAKVTSTPTPTVTTANTPVAAVVTAPESSAMTPPTADPTSTTIVTEEAEPVAVLDPPMTEDVGPTLVESGTWIDLEYKRGVPLPRHESCAVFAEGLLYSIGGRGIKSTSVFNPITGSWSSVSGPPVELNHMQCLYYKNRIYIGGSWYGEFPYEKEHADTWVYDIPSDSWLTLPGLPAERRRGGGAFVNYKGKFYLSHGGRGGHGNHATTTGMFDMYDPETNTWTPLADAPNPRDHTNGAIINDKLCVAGGRDGGTTDFWNANIAPIDCFNFVTMKWEVKADLPMPRCGTMVGTTCQGRLMIAGGEGKTASNQAGQAFDRVDFFDEATNSFDEPSYMTSSRHGSGVGVTSCSCGNIYIPSGSAGLGGGPEVLTTDLWSPDGEIRSCV